MPVNVTIRKCVSRLMSLCVVLLLLSQSMLVAAQQEDPSPVASRTQPASPAKTLAESSSSAGNVVAEDRLPDAPEPQSQPQDKQQQAPPSSQQPIGTAAAPLEKPTGVPGSRPSGAAIAPAKQRRVRTFVISIGIILAAGAAVGTVVGLSKASHSTP